jgi:hypothetical protein
MTAPHCSLRSGHSSSRLAFPFFNGLERFCNYQPGLDNGQDGLFADRGPLSASEPAPERSGAGFASVRGVGEAHTPGTPASGKWISTSRCAGLAFDASPILLVAAGLADRGESKCWTLVLTIGPAWSRRCRRAACPEGREAKCRRDTRHRLSARKARGELFHDSIESTRLHDRPPGVHDASAPGTRAQGMRLIRLSRKR